MLPAVYVLQKIGFLQHRYRFLVKYRESACLDVKKHVPSLPLATLQIMPVEFMWVVLRKVLSAVKTFQKSQLLGGGLYCMMCTKFSVGF